MQEPIHTWKSRVPRIGLTACIFHKDPLRPLFKGKALYYYEEMMISWIQELGLSPVLIPPPGTTRGSELEKVCATLDGLVLQGGVDVCPESYGEKPLKPEWNGDLARDRYELEIAALCDARKVPMLGICRGAQVLAVHAGGTLYQDIETQIPGSLVHRTWDLYEDNKHDVELVAGSAFAKLYPGVTRGRINSIHHQSVKDVPPGCEVGAVSPVDGVVEAFMRVDPNKGYLHAVQWHPEFHRPGVDDELLPRTPLLAGFARAVEQSILVP